MKAISQISQFIIPIFILFVIIYGTLKKVSVYDSFISGAKSAFTTVLGIFPYLLAIFIAVKTFQVSGAFDFLSASLSGVMGSLHIPVEALQIAVVKPLSGSASLGVFTETVKSTGADSMASKMSAIIMGSAETTFYVIAVYLGSVNIKKSRYLVPVCLITDVFGIFLAITLAKLFF